MFPLDPAERCQALEFIQNENQVQSLSGTSLCPHYQGPASVPGWHMQAIWPMQVEPVRPFHSTALSHLRQYCQSWDEDEG
jgi:hypothetical protein